MNKNLGVELVIYSVLLAGLSCLVRYLSPAIAMPVLIAGIIGGALCLVWGLRAVRGNRSKVLPILTLVPINFVMLSQAILGWAGGSQEVPGRRPAAVVITILFALSIGILMLIAYAGVTFDEQPSNPGKEQPTK